ncbi:unnamed protein product, partial [Phaeothamnion confervicola]
PQHIDARDGDGSTLLIVALQHACHGLVELMLTKGADPAAVNAAGVCPLHYACYADTLSRAAASALLRFGADPATAELTYGCTPLHYAASSGDKALCVLLIEHGADASIQDYYNCSAVHYAREAGHTALAAFLGQGGEEAKEANQAAATGGMWVRATDPTSNAAYHMNDATGESWWESDLLASAREYFAAAAGSGAAAAEAAAVLAPGVRGWLRQQQARAQLVALLARVDPLRLPEIDQQMEANKNEYDAMFENLFKEYGIKDRSFMAEAFASPGAAAAATASAGGGGGGGGRDAGSHDDDEAVTELDLSALDALDIRVAGRDGGGGDSPWAGTLVPALVDVEAQQASEEQLAEQQRELEADREQHAKAMAQRGAAADGLEKQLAHLREAAEEAQAKLATLTARRDALLPGGAVDAENDPARWEQRLEKLHSDLAGERAMYGHLLQATEDLKGSAEERREERARADAERESRLAAAEADAAAEAKRLTEEGTAAEAAAAAAWQEEQTALAARLEGAVAAALATLQLAKDGAAEALGEAGADTAASSAATKRFREEADASRQWMRQNGSRISEAATAATANRVLHGQLRREMERAKQLHNQIEDMKGRCRVVARLRPLALREQAAGCKEATFRDGKKAVGTLLGDRRVWDLDLVLQSNGPPANFGGGIGGGDGGGGPAAAAAGVAAQRELFAELASLATSLADGHNICFLVAGGVGAGRSFTLRGSPSEAALAAALADAAAAANAAAAGAVATATANGSAAAGGAAHLHPPGVAVNSFGHRRKSADNGVGGGGGAGGATAAAAAGTEQTVGPLAGLLPRLLVEAFRVLSERDAQAAFRVAVGAAA